jgi:hypothetical protein
VGCLFLASAFGHLLVVGANPDLGVPNFGCLPNGEISKLALAPCVGTGLCLGGGVAGTFPTVEEVGGELAPAAVGFPGSEDPTRQEGCVDALLGAWLLDAEPSEDVFEVGVSLRFAALRFRFDGRFLPEESGDDRGELRVFRRVRVPVAGPCLRRGDVPGCSRGEWNPGLLLRLRRSRTGR